MSLLQRLEQEPRLINTCHSPGPGDWFELVRQDTMSTRGVSEMLPYLQKQE